MEREHRIKQFAADELGKKPFVPEETGFPDPSSVMQEYIKAKRLVDSLSARFKTEYSRQYLDWNPTSLAGKSTDLIVSKKNEDSIKSNVHLDTPVQFISNADSDFRDFKSEYNGRYISSATLECIPKTHAAGLASGLTISKPKRTNQPQVHFDVAKPTKIKRDTAPVPVDFIKVQSIYKSLKPAGISGAEGWKERRHYEPQVKLDVEKGQTWKLAHDLLERCRLKA